MSEEAVEQAREERQQRVIPHFFDACDNYTTEAFHFDSEIADTLRPIFERYIAQGYSPRDIASLMLRTVFDLELSILLESKLKQENNGNSIGEIYERSLPDLFTTIERS